MSRVSLGYLIPLVLTAVTSLFSVFCLSVPSLRWGVVVGVSLALLQSWLSVASMNWAWDKAWFYWVWGGGFFFRMLICAVTALVVYRLTTLNLAATLLSLICSTMIFLIIESSLLFWQRK